MTDTSHPLAASVLLLALFALSACSLASAGGTPLTLILEGREKATYTVSYTDGSQDKITMDLAIDLTFNPVPPVLTGDRYVSSRADTQGHIHAIVTAVQKFRNEETTISFDKDINYVKTLGVPLRIEFSALDGSVTFISLDIADRDLVASDDLKPYRLEYSGSKRKANVWVRLPRPFRYPENYEVYDVGLTARLSEVQGELRGAVLSLTRNPIAGASVRLDGSLNITTDASGVFRLAGLSPGSHQVQITKPGYEPLTTTAIVRPYGTTQTEFLLNPQSTLLTGSLEFIDQPRPILPGQKRSAKLTLQNTSANPLNGFVRANVLLSARQDNGVTTRLPTPPPLSVILASGQAGVFDIAVDMPSASELGSDHAGLNHLLVHLEPQAGFPTIPAGEDTLACPPFWVGQVVNVLTHGFGNDLEVPFFGRVTEPSFIGIWNQMARVFSQLAVDKTHPMAGSVKNKVVVWNSSDGWVQGVAVLVVAEACKRFNQELAAKLAELASEIFRETGRTRAEQTANETKLALQEEGLIPSVIEAQLGYVVVHLIGHSRGAAVNARLAKLLAADGYVVNQYTALDGYSNDWPPPSHLLADIPIVEELSGTDSRRFIHRRVNYRVQDGLFQEQAANLLFPLLDPFFRFLYEFLFGRQDYRGISPILKETLRASLPDFRAPNRPPELFENRMITGFGFSKDKDRSNHLNVVDLYLESPSRPDSADRYLYDNFIGHRLGLWATPAPATLPTTDSPRHLARASIPNETSSSENKFSEFRDGAFEEVGALSDRIVSTPFPEIDDDVFRIGVALLRDPRQLLAARWSAGGNLALVQNGSGHAVEARTGTNTFLGQWLTLGPAAASVDFDLSVVATRSGNSLSVKFGTNVLRQISLTNAGISERLSVSLQRFWGPGEVSFQLSGPSETPATIRLDNLAIVYSQPKITRVQVQPDGVFRFSVEGRAGSRYAVETSIDLVRWSQVATLENPTGTVAFVEGEAGNSANSFYRVRILP